MFCYSQDNYVCNKPWGNVWALLCNGILMNLELLCSICSFRLCYDMIWIVRSLRPNDFWYGPKCCTELSVAVRVTSRIRTRHLLSPYICELGLWPICDIWAYGRSVSVRPMAVLYYLWARGHSVRFVGLKPIWAYGHSVWSVRPEANLYFLVWYKILYCTKCYSVSHL